jgi:SAM-dependent methyltransferase
MKDSLSRHIKDILTSQGITNSFEVYDCVTDTLPKWLKHIQPTHEFLVCCDSIPNKQKLQLFLGKEIYEVDNHFYWFEGERTIHEIPVVSNITIENGIEQKIDYLKTETQLPAWLDSFIFNDLKAEYAPNFQRFDYNLDLTKEESLKYLGTYFPRSYAESFCIFDNIFKNGSFQNAISNKQSFNILSVGCGTGGDIIGLLTIIEKYCSKIKTINIWAIDGNKDAVDLLKKIIGKQKAQTNKRIELQTISCIFDDFLKVDLNKLEIQDIDFDFILSFKMICEIIALGKENSYYDFVKMFVSLLSETGLCLLLDVTVRSKNGIFLPILLNTQINLALRELKDYKTLLPLSCGNFENVCNEQCFTQKHFFVTHQQKTKDLSKVNYRVIGHKKFTKLLIGNKEQQKYILQKGDKTTFCPKSESGIIIDSYKL